MAVPIGEMAQHPGDGPILVRGSRKSLIVHPLDEGTEPLTLSRVDLDVGTILRHRLPPTQSDRPDGPPMMVPPALRLQPFCFPQGVGSSNRRAFGANARGMSLKEGGAVDASMQKDPSAARP